MIYLVFVCFTKHSYLTNDQNYTIGDDIFKHTHIHNIYKNIFTICVRTQNQAVRSVCNCGLNTSAKPFSPGLPLK